MRYVLGIVEVLLAILFIGSAVVNVVKGEVGAVQLAASLLMVALGLWLAKKAMENLRGKDRDRSHLTVMKLK